MWPYWAESSRCRINDDFDSMKISKQDLNMPSVRFSTALIQWQQFAHF